MNILITGGAGFIGSNLAIKLLESKSYEITIIDSMSEQIHGKDPSPLETNKDIKFIKSSVNEYQAIKQSVLESDVIYHLASETGAGQSNVEIQHYCDTNIMGLANILDILANNKSSVKKFVLASSRAVYGEGQYTCASFPDSEGITPTRKFSDLIKKKWEPKSSLNDEDLLSCPTKESAKKKPASIYASTKLMQENLLLSFSNLMDIQCFALRFQNVYGAGQSLQNPYTGIISIFGNRIRQNLDIRLYEDGLQTRDFIYVDDAVNGLKRCLDVDIKKFETINIGFGEPVSVLKIAKLLFKNLGKKENICKSENFRLGDIRHNYADTKKMENILCFKPEINIEKGINKFCNWIKTQPIYADSLNEAENKLKKNNLMFNTNEK